MHVRQCEHFQETCATIGLKNATSGNQRVKPSKLRSGSCSKDHQFGELPVYEHSVLPAGIGDPKSDAHRMILNGFQRGRGSHAL